MNNIASKPRVGFQARSVAAVFLVVTALLTAAPAAVPMVQSQAPPAGCHEHGRHAPQPAPASYQCCQTGHNAAVLENVPPISPLVFISRSSAPEAVLVSSPAHDGSDRLLASSSSPPGLTPLRV